MDVVAMAAGGVIQEDRDAGFWTSVAHHPDVWPGISLGQEIDVAAIVANPLVTPLRAEHGGLFFVRLDGIGRVFEMHTLFLPAGWGREAAIAMRHAIAEMFRRGAELITSYDVEGDRRTGPPHSMGFATAGGFAPTHLGRSLRTWFLTRAAWEASPASRRVK